MTTAREIKKLVAPLLARHSDLVLIRRLIAIRPVHHMLRFIYIDSTSTAAVFKPRYVVNLLFYKGEDIVLSPGEMLYRYGAYKPGLWCLSDPEISQDFVAVMEREALPKLRAMQTLQDYLDFLPKPGALDFSMSNRILVDIALGDFATAREGMTDRLGKAWVPYLDKQSAGLGTRILEHGAALSPADRREIVRLLHEWEAHTVEKLKIAHLWERTPFPLEMQIA